MSYKNINFDTIASTNGWLSNEVQLGNTTDRLVVSANFQTHGMGMTSNVWHSKKNQNILCSIGLKPDKILPAEQFLLSKLISLAALDVLQLYLPTSELQVKWPNDIYVNDCKIAGALISCTILGNTIDYAVVGLGMNVNQSNFPKWIPNPVSMKLIAGKRFDRILIQNQIVTAFFKRYDEYAETKYRLSIDRLYLQRMYRFAVKAPYLINNRKVMAKIEGVNEFGQLLLRQADEKLDAYDMKEVVFLQAK